MENKKKLNFLSFLICVCILLVSAIIYHHIILEHAKEKYRIENNMPDIRHPEEKGMFGKAEYYSKPEVSIEDIGGEYNMILLYTFLFLFVYPFIGRIVISLSQSMSAYFDKLCGDMELTLVDEKFKLNRWDADTILYCSVLLPVAITIATFLILSIFLLLIYKHLN